MNPKTLALGAAAFAVVATSVVIGRRGEIIAHDTRSAAMPPAIDALPAAVVVARRPTLSEILDLVLRERPTAAELGARGSGSAGFPAGSDEAHVAKTLRRYTTDARLADRIASALVKEGRRRKVGSSLLVGVLLTENPWLDPRATSSVGAKGLMQVMPFHAGNWGCASPDLLDVESNVCHGVAILADDLSHARNLPQALLGYNGCVRGTNTPNCWRYPATVYRQARKGEANGIAFAPRTAKAASRGALTP
ncbi:MAG: transglycosylase SLT domain-containing protein [Gemmatimonadales bacterium]